jgi:hypothetical protein
MLVPGLQNPAQEVNRMQRKPMILSFALIVLCPALARADTARPTRLKAGVFTPRVIYPDNTHLGREVALPAARVLHAVSKHRLKEYRPNPDKDKGPIQKEVVEAVHVQDLQRQMDRHYGCPVNASLEVYASHRENVRAKSQQIFGPWGVSEEDVSTMVNRNRVAGGDGNPIITRTRIVTTERPETLKNPQVAIAKRILERAKKDPVYGKGLKAVMGNTAALATIFREGHRDEVRLANWPHRPKLKEGYRRLFNDLTELASTEHTVAYTAWRNQWAPFSAKNRGFVEDAAREADAIRRAPKSR